MPRRLMHDASHAADASAAWYFREARRLRGRWARHPHQLQQSLRLLGRMRDAQVQANRTGEQWAVPTQPPSHAPVRRVSRHIPPERTPTEATQSPRLPHQPVIRGIGIAWTPVVERFADRVGQAIEQEGMLRHDRRAKLLRQAASERIDPFQANLIMAAIQHEYLAGRPIASTSTLTAASRAPRQAMPAWLIALFAFAFESALLFGVWWMVR